MSGAQVLERLAGDPATSAIPVLIVSADATPGQIKKLEDAAAAGYMTKPIDVGMLLETVRRYLSLAAVHELAESTPSPLRRARDGLRATR